MNIKRHQIVFVLCFLCRVGYGQTKDKEIVINKLLNYIEQSQVGYEEAGEDSIYKGLWLSEITNLKSSVFFGRKGKSSSDANCFVSCMVHNLLAELYLEGYRYEQIPQIIDKSLPAINSFKDGFGYHFFPRVKDSLGVPELMTLTRYGDPERKASHFEYTSRFIKSGFNIYNDSDDTALAYYANYLSKQIDPKNEDLINIVPNDLSDFLLQYRDVEGSGTNMWNWLRRTGSKTGAFLTWLPYLDDAHEHPFFPKKGQKYIPFGVNDVDCVLNANILGVLKAMETDMSPELVQVENWLLSVMEYPKCRRCAIYYPTGNMLYYSVLNAFCRGANGLKTAIPLILEGLIASQNEQGYWIDRINGNHIQSSLNAVSTLIKIKKCGGAEFTNDRRLDDCISRGVTYLLSQLKEVDHMARLDGGIVFSAGFVFKKKHVWKSDVWATAMLLEILINYE